MTAEPTHRDPPRPAPPPAKRRWALPGGLALGLAALAWLATGVYSVRTEERVVVRRLGRALEEARKPGLHVGLPRGLEVITRLKALETKRVAVGMGLADRALGRTGRDLQAECLTGDTNLILVSAVVQYRASDRNEYRDYCFRVADVPGLVRCVAAAELTRLLSRMNVDDILTVQRVAIQNQVRDATQQALDRYRAGVRITSVLLPSRGVAPPQEVADAFRDVTSAREDRQRAINVAEGYAGRLAPEARGEAHRIGAEADAYAHEIVEKARGDAERFEKEAAELAANRRLTLRRLVLETMEDVLPRVHKIVLDAKAREALDLGIIESKEGP